jgi:L-alanine-DL-glutamate epimerase-like enolase superfamily enzyme
VAAVSTVPLMLDEPICSLADVDRAAGMAGVDYCKVKLKRFVSLQRLDEVLTHIRARGLAPVLGDGLACEPGCWMEACVASRHVDNAGEFNGFLKPRARLFSAPLRFEAGCVLLEPGTPRIDEAVLDAHTLERVAFGNV